MVVETVKVDVAVPFAAGVTDVKLNPQVTVALTGEIAQVKFTAALKPLREMTVIRDEVLFPTVVVAVAGVADKPKSITVKI